MRPQLRGAAAALAVLLLTSSRHVSAQPATGSAPSQRPPVHALYGFARYADDILDDMEMDASTADRERRLDKLSDNFFNGDEAEPVLAAVLHTARTYQIPLDLFDDFLTSMRMDLTVTDYPDRPALNHYMRGSAAVIGLQMLPILGTVGPVTAEVVEKSEGAYRAGDVAGLTGLQARYDEQLRGTAGVNVAAVKGEKRRSLFSTEATPGDPLATTLVPRLQQAAERILAPVGPPSALVAIRPSSGEILAAASGPGSGGHTSGQLNSANTKSSSSFGGAAGWQRSPFSRPGVANRQRAKSPVACGARLYASLSVSAGTSTSSTAVPSRSSSSMRSPLELILNGRWSSPCSGESSAQSTITSPGGIVRAGSGTRRPLSSRTANASR